MGNNFSINKSGYSLEEIANKFNHYPTTPIILSEDSATFEANYKEPVFSAGQDGRLQGGDESAMKIFMQKFANKEEEKEATESDAVAEESSVVANMAFAEVDPTCCQ